MPNSFPRSYIGLLHHLFWGSHLESLDLPTFCTDRNLALPILVFLAESLLFFIMDGSSRRNMWPFGLLSLSFFSPFSILFIQHFLFQGLVHTYCGLSRQSFKLYNSSLACWIESSLSLSTFSQNNFSPSHNLFFILNQLFSFPEVPPCQSHPWASKMSENV